MTRFITKLFAGAKGSRKGVAGRVRVRPSLECLDGREMPAVVLTAPAAQLAVGAKTAVVAAGINIQVVAQAANQAVVVNGRTVGVFTAVKDVRVSADGQHYGFVGMNIDNRAGTMRAVAVIDGVTRGTFNNNVVNLQLSNTGGHYVFAGIDIDNRLGTARASIVYDGVTRTTFTKGVSALKLSADGLHYAVLGQNSINGAINSVVFVDGSTRWSSSAVMSQLTLSNDGRRFAAVESFGLGVNATRVILDGRVVQTLTSVTSLTFTASNQLTIDGIFGTQRMVKTVS